MCGIAGIFNTTGQPLPPQASRAIKSMTDRMAYRGPDGEGLWQDGPVCLGHRRLSIIDIAGGAQPMQSRDKRLCIVFNGEIYNFRELRGELEASGAVFVSSSDTEVILAAYDKWGTGCLDRLEGMFAFALWDAKRNILFCARDRFGKKPFFYTLQQGLFCFASELGPLRAVAETAQFGGFSFSLDPLSLTRYLAYEYAPCPHTMYNEVRSLEPSHFIIVGEKGTERQRYWDLPMPAKNLPAPEDELCRRLEDLLARACKMRMISDVPLGVFLSGGIDSSIVAGLMARQSATPVQSFSIGFREASYDESGYARLVAKAFGTSHHERILSAAQCADELPGIVRSMDQPMADASCAPTWLLSGLARENVTVALGGDGSDELWAGYEHFIGFRIAQWYRMMPRVLRRYLIEPACRLLPASAGYINPRLAAATFLRGAAAPDWLRVQTMLTAFTPELLAGILSAEWKASYGKFLQRDILFAPTREHYGHWPEEAGVSPLERAFYVYARQFLLDDILVKVDRCSMLHSLEVRAPFLDRRVAEFAAALPLSCKLHGFRRKYLLKKAFSGLLPKEILKRNKRGFQIPVAEWLRGRMRPLMEDLLDADCLRRQGIFEPAGVRKLMDEHVSGKKDRRKQLWTLIVLELWLQANQPALK